MFRYNYYALRFGFARNIRLVCKPRPHTTHVRDSMATKIYFAASIRGGRQDAHIYSKIVALLKNYGRVLTEHVGDQSLTAGGRNYKNKKCFSISRSAVLNWIKI